VLAYYSRALGGAGQTDRGIEVAIEACRIADSVDDPGNRTLMRTRLADQYQFAGVHREALGLMDGVLASPDAPPVAWYLRFVSLIWRGRLVDARAAAERTLELVPRFVEAGEPATHEATYHWLAKLEAFRGFGEQSLAFAQRAVELAPARLGLLVRCLSDWGMGVARLCLGQWQASITVLESARALQQSVDTPRQHEARILAPLAEAYLGAGDRERALATAEAARRAGRELGTRHWEAEACLAHTRALLAGTPHEKDRDAAERALERAEELVLETGNDVLSPFILEERAKLSLSRGCAAAHARGLRESHRLHTEMGATGHAERLARELEHLPAPARTPQQYSGS
jgi:tetratricopeptide (TPR) repeat protein